MKVFITWPKRHKGVKAQRLNGRLEWRKGAMIQWVNCILCPYAFKPLSHYAIITLKSELITYLRTQINKVISTKRC